MNRHVPAIPECCYPVARVVTFSCDNVYPDVLGWKTDCVYAVNRDDRDCPMQNIHINQPGWRVLQAQEQKRSIVVTLVPIDTTPEEWNNP